MVDRKREMNNTGTYRSRKVGGQEGIADFRGFPSKQQLYASRKGLIILGGLDAEAVLGIRIRAVAQSSRTRNGVSAIFIL
jgi:hypothetical protein